MPIPFAAGLAGLGRAAASAGKRWFGKGARDSAREKMKGAASSAGSVLEEGLMGDAIDDAAYNASRAGGLGMAALKYGGAGLGGLLGVSAIMNALTPTDRQELTREYKQALETGFEGSFEDFVRSQYMPQDDAIGNRLAELESMRRY